MKTTAVAMAGAAFLGVGCEVGGPGGAAGARHSSPALADGGAAQGRHAGSGRLRSLPPQLRFDGRTLDGRPFTGANLAERPVVFWFWAPWCPKCISEAPHVAEVAKKYGHRVTFVGIAGFDDSKDQMQLFVTRTGTGDITQLDDRTGSLFAHFKVTTVPSLLLMTAAGRHKRITGQVDRPTLEQALRRLAGG